MRVLVVNAADVASCNIRDRLLESHDWVETNGKFRKNPIFQRGYDMLVTVAGPTVFDEYLNQDLVDTNWPIQAIWFLSKHRAASGTMSLTVHPIGNYGEAMAGGLPSVLAPAAARDMGALLRRIHHHRDAAKLPHQVTFEATHHGPVTTTPTLFLEIGSDDPHYDDQAAGAAWANAIHDVLDGEGIVAGPLLVGVGGGHYVPRLTDLTLEGVCDFGHMVPAYQIGESAEAVKLAIEATPGCEGVYVHKKGLKGPQRQLVKELIENMGVQVVDLKGE